MSDPYERAKGGRLTFKGGTLATRKSIEKKKKKNKSKVADHGIESDNPTAPDAVAADNVSAGEVFTIDAAKNMNYDQLFPVEAKKFGYDAELAAAARSKSKTVEEALDDRVKKKADRYCK